MPRRLRPHRAGGLVASLLVLAGLVAACGGETGVNEGAVPRLEAVTIEGDVGTEPQISWQQPMSAGSPEVETLVEGDGGELADGDKVLVNFVLANGYTQETNLNTFGKQEAGVWLTVGGGEEAQPRSVGDLVASFLTDQVEAGATRGSRLAITADAEQIFGQSVFAEPVGSLGIGNLDPMLLVVDLLDVQVLEGPQGDEQRPPAWAPSILSEQGEPTALDFSDTPPPSGRLRTAVLTQGTGDKVQKGDLMVVDYLGQVPGSDKPFDESYSRDEPFPTPIGLGQVVPGWDKELVGVPVGSRVILEIPPEEGYGKQGQGSIPPNATLYFVVDVLASV